MKPRPTAEPAQAPADLPARPSRRELFGTALALLGGVSRAVASTPEPETLPMNASDRDLAALRMLNARFIHNFVTNDVASHDAILHPRFICITQSGARVDRTPYLRAWATGFDPENLVHWDTRDERIDVFGDVALVRATNKHVHLRGGKEAMGMTCYTDTYLRDAGRWLCIQAQLTTLAPQHYPGDDSVINTYLRGRLQPRA